MFVFSLPFATFSYGNNGIVNWGANTIMLEPTRIKFPDASKRNSDAMIQRKKRLSTRVIIRFQRSVLRVSLFLFFMTTQQGFTPVL